MATKRIMVNIEGDEWREFLEWGKDHNARGYNNRVTVSATVKAILKAVKECEVSSETKEARQKRIRDSLTELTAKTVTADQFIERQQRH